MVVGLIPFGTRWRPHHKRDWYGLPRLQAPPMYKPGAQKHRIARDMQTSLTLGLNLEQAHLAVV
jgi:hypothetical protein